jgi:RpiR family carbohydrate utilization transcriptional regulator
MAITERSEWAASASIRALLPALVPSEVRVATLFLDHPGEIIHLSVTEMAALAGSSASTVVRCCQRLGFQGFQDLKIALAQESLPAVARLQSAVEEGDPPATVLAKVVEAGADAIRSAVATVAPDAFERAIGALDAAGRVLVVGVGSSAPIAQDAAYRFVTIGLRAEAPPDVHVQHVAARMLGPGDVCLAISHTGSTRETLAATRAAAEAGATTIAITSFLRSPLTEVAAITLVAGSRETNYRVEAMASRMAHLAVLDALFVAVALQDRQRALAAQDAHAAVMAEHRF